MERTSEGNPNSIRKPHQCDHCTKSFASSHQLAQHLRTHTGEKPYRCSYCEKSFKQLSHVQQHTRLHTGERPYKCPVPDCGRAFIQLSNLQQHMRNHVSSQDKLDRDKEKSHFCNVCGKGFKAQANLLTHKCRNNLEGMASHRHGHGHVTEVCPVCQTNLPNKEAVIQHLRDHHHNATNDTQLKKKYSSTACPVCGKTYINETSLRKHLAAHSESGSGLASTSGNGFWPCCVCKNVFTTETGLLNHMEQMRTDSRHQFEAQIVLSCAAAERRAREVVISHAAIAAHQLMTQTDTESEEDTVLQIRTSNGSLLSSSSSSLNIKDANHANHELDLEVDDEGLVDEINRV